MALDEIVVVNPLILNFNAMPIPKNDIHYMFAVDKHANLGVSFSFNRKNTPYGGTVKTLFGLLGLMGNKDQFVSVDNGRRYYHIFKHFLYLEEFRRGDFIYPKGEIVHTSHEALYWIDVDSFTSKTNYRKESFYLLKDEEVDPWQLSGKDVLERPLTKESLLNRIILDADQYVLHEKSGSLLSFCLRENSAVFESSNSYYSGSLSSIWSYYGGLSKSNQEKHNIHFMGRMYLIVNANEVSEYTFETDNSKVIYKGQIVSTFIGYIYDFFNKKWNGEDGFEFDLEAYKKSISI